METLKLDGSIGHGGGQILRSALALSAILGKPFEMHSIRKDRSQPGLRRQHLCGVLAAAEICGAKLEGAELGSEDLLFIPKKIKAGTYQFAVGTGGSVSLVLQSVLLPLAVQKMKSHISVAGGTYTPQAPTAEFFAETLVPRMNQMGYSIQTEIARAGFFRIGGGLVKVDCCRKDTFMPIYWMNRETPRKCFIQIVTSQFPEKTTLKIAKLIREELSKMRNMIPYELEITENPDIEEPGAAVIVRTAGRNPTVFSEIAQYGYSSESLARSLGKQIRGFLAASAPIETHLADQIILPLFFAAGGSFLTKGSSEHLESCIQILELFTGQKVKTEKDGKCLVVHVPKLREDKMIKGKDLEELKVPKVIEIRAKLYEALGKSYAAGKKDSELKPLVGKLAVSSKPTEVLEQEEIPEEARESFRAVAEELEKFRSGRIVYSERKEKAPWKLWGTEKVEARALEQMDEAVSLPISVGGALMPDAHQGYGLPIGGVLATKNAVIPYAVGVDIACRMRISILDIPYEEFEKDRRSFGAALLEETRFGVGVTFEPGKRTHKVMEDPLWRKPGVVKENYKRALSQLGTSGHGNHFVEFGKLTVENDIDEPTLKIKAGTYTALLSHSGSRGLGLHVANHFSELAQQLHPELPENLKRLAWLELDTQEGKDYWEAMELCGKYAEANHELIHESVIEALGCGVLGFVENHHNFAWKEMYDGEELIVHRKGATPAGKGKLGVVPGSMGSPGFIVRGKGNAESFNSCSHGAGRVMSRAAAFRNLKHADMKKILKEQGITLIGGTLDESPEVYKDINKVIDGQRDLVDVLAKFEPKLVRMAAEGNQWGNKKKKKKPESKGDGDVCM